MVFIIMVCLLPHTSHKINITHTTYTRQLKGNVTHSSLLLPSTYSFSHVKSDRSESLPQEDNKLDTKAMTPGQIILREIISICRDVILREKVSE